MGTIPMSSLVLLILLFVSTYCFSHDQDLSKSLQHALDEERFVLVLENLSPRRRGRAHTEVLMTVDFGSTKNHVGFALDRKNNQILIETVENGAKKTLNIPATFLNDQSVHKSLVAEVSQSWTGATRIALYLDCSSLGLVSLSKNFRDMMSKLHPSLEVLQLLEPFLMEPQDSGVFLIPWDIVLY